MNIVNFTSRPQVTEATRWTGDNKTELEAHYSEVFGTSVTFSVNGSGALVIEGYPFSVTSPVPEGYWFGNQFMGSISNEELLAYQIVTGNAPYSFNVTGD